MTKLLVFFLATQLPLSQAWVPVQTLSYSQLPKTLEFAEKAWVFPKSENINGPRSLPEDHQRRMLPWTHQQHSIASSNNRHFYFDGFSGVTEWPAREVYKSRTSLQMTCKTAPPKTAELYYDDTGNSVSWGVTRHQEEHHYFDDLGYSCSWFVSAPESQLFKRSAASKPGPAVLGLETCKEHYFGDTGDLLCWQ